MWLSADDYEHIEHDRSSTTQPRTVRTKHDRSIWTVQIVETLWCGNNYEVPASEHDRSSTNQPRTVRIKHDRSTTNCSDCWVVVDAVPIP